MKSINIKIIVDFIKKAHIIYLNSHKEEKYEKNNDCPSSNITPSFGYGN